MWVPSCYLIAIGTAVGLFLCLRLFAVAVHWFRVPHGATSIAFFHPYCAQGGGGERVLWKAITAIVKQVRLPAGRKLVLYVYSGDAEAITAPESILDHAAERFEIPELRQIDVRFVRLRSRCLLEARWYPRFTLLLQSLAAAFVSFEALIRLAPHVFFDTTGFAFSYPVARLLFGCRVGCYTHYPTISTDMLQRVQERRPSYNNHDFIARSCPLSVLKLTYYRIFSALYSFAGFFCSVVMVNSTWTLGHISKLWGSRSRGIHVIFPPCNTTALAPSEDTAHPRECVVLSVGQFRPEKDHLLQVHAFALFLERLAERHPDAPLPRLVLLGGCRNEGDRAIVSAVQAAARALHIEGQVDVMANAPFVDLQRLLRTSLVGLHSMWNEHFGICVVEFMAAGAITLAHNSGGPKLDIVVPFDGGETGFLASTKEEYAEALLTVFDLFERDPNALASMRQRARKRAEEFSDSAFEHNFAAAFRPLCL